MLVWASWFVSGPWNASSAWLNPIHPVRHHASLLLSSQLSSAHVSLLVTWLQSSLFQQHQGIAFISRVLEPVDTHVPQPSVSMGAVSDWSHIICPGPSRGCTLEFCMDCWPEPNWLSTCSFNIRALSFQKVHQEKCLWKIPDDLRFYILIFSIKI